MGANRIAIAAFVLLVLVGLFVWQMQTQDAEIDAAPDVEVTLPKVDTKTIDELEFAAPDKPRTRHVKQGGEWRLVEPLDAKSDQTAIRTALDKLQELEVTGVAATKKEIHERLEVDEKKGTRVTAKAGGKTVLDIWIGLYNAGNSMLRKEGEEAVATVKGSIRFAFSKLLREWRDRSVVSLDTDKVRALELSNAKGTLRFVKSEGWTQAPGEKPIERFDPEKVKTLVTMIATLDAVDFAEPNATAAETGLDESAAAVRVTTEDDQEGGEIVLRVGKTKGTDHYLEQQGVAQKFLVSKWVAERLTGGADAFQKPEEGAAAAAEPGSPANPVPVHPIDPHSPEMQKKIQEALQQAQQK